MKQILSAFGIIAFVILSFSMPFSGCTKTNTKFDTTIKVDTFVVPGDTAWKHLRDSLWAYYPIQGNTQDSTPAGHVLTLNGPTLGYDMWGNNNYAIQFPGGGAYASIADGANFSPASFSVTMYILSSNNNGLLFGKQDWATGHSAIWNFGIDPANSPGQLRFSVTGNQSTICGGVATGSASYAMDPTADYFQAYSWYQVGITFSGGVMILYVNGQQVATNTITTQQLVVCNQGQFILGNWWSGDNGPTFTGRMNQIRIYSRALTPHEVAYMFQYHL